MTKYMLLSRRDFLGKGISGITLFGIFELCGQGLFFRSLKDNSILAPRLDQESEKGFMENLRKKYFSALNRRLEELFPEQANSIGDDIDKRHQDIIRKNQAWIVDPPAEFHLFLTSLVLATYQVLVRKTNSKDTAMDIARFAFFEAQQHKAVKAYLVSMVEKEPDPFTMMVKISKSKEEKQYGKTFVFERERDDDTHYFLNVKKCFYHDFFSAHGAPELTPVFCDWDNVWGDELKDGRFGVKFERPETIGYGGSVCRFQFTRTERQSNL